MDVLLHLRVLGVRRHDWSGGLEDVGVLHLLLQLSLPTTEDVHLESNKLEFTLRKPVLETDVGRQCLPTPATL